MEKVNNYLIQSVHWQISVNCYKIRSKLRDKTSKFEKDQTTWQVFLSQQSPVAQVALGNKVQFVALQHLLSQSWNGYTRFNVTMS